MKLVGQNIGRYHIVEELGTGGMASVYKAYDTRLERDVAVKVIRRDMVAEVHASQMLRRFEREARALARLEHPNIVNVHDYGEYEGAPYLVMQYLTGGTLRELTGKSMPYGEAARLLIPIAHALGYAHSMDIVHRDVKPANILITASGQPMLSDFGIAKILAADDTTRLTGTGVGIGTPEYMAPEQGMSRQVDQRADIYALGVVFYELVTGRKPFTADTPMAVVVKHINDPLPRPRLYVPALPEAVEVILFKALAKEPEDRYPDMQAFAAALQNLPDDQTAATLTQPPLPPALHRAASEGGPGRRYLWIGGVVLLLLVGGCVAAALAGVGLSGLLGRDATAAAGMPQSAAELPQGTVKESPRPSNTPRGSVDPSLQPSSTATSTWTPTATMTPTETPLPEHELEIALEWYSGADLDLKLVDAYGEVITWADPFSESGGVHERDENKDCDLASSSPQERIYWPDADAPPGEYIVRVWYAQDSCEPGAGDQDYRVEVSLDGSVVETFSDIIGYYDDSHEHYFMVGD